MLNREDYTPARNRALIADLFTAELRIVLIALVEERMRNVYGPRWRLKAVDLLGRGRHDVVAEDIERDVKRLLELILRDYGTFKSILRTKGRTLVQQLLTIRNLWAHEPELDLADAFHAYDCLVKLFELLGHDAAYIRRRRQDTQTLLAADEAVPESTPRVSGPATSARVVPSTPTPPDRATPSREVQASPRTRQASGPSLASTTQLEHNAAASKYSAPRQVAKNTKYRLLAAVVGGAMLLGLSTLSSFSWLDSPKPPENGAPAVSVSPANGANQSPPRVSAIQVRAQITSLAISEDDQAVIGDNNCYSDKPIVVDLKTGTPRNLSLTSPSPRRDPNGRTVCFTAFSGNRHWLATTSDRGVSVWEWNSEAPLLTTTLPMYDVSALALDFDGLYIAIGARNGVSIWRRDGRMVRKVEGAGAFPDTIAFSRSNELLFAAGGQTADGISEWNLSSLKYRVFGLPADDVRVHSDGAILAGGIVNGIAMYRPGTFRPLWKLDETTCAIAIDEKTGSVVTGGVGNDIVIRDGVSGARVRTLQGHSSPVCSLGFLTDGTLVSGGYDGRVRIWQK